MLMAGYIEFHRLRLSFLLKTFLLNPKIFVESNRFQFHVKPRSYSEFHQVSLSSAQRNLSTAHNPRAQHSSSFNRDSNQRCAVLVRTRNTRQPVRRCYVASASVCCYYWAILLFFFFLLKKKISLVYYCFQINVERRS